MKSSIVWGESLTGLGGRGGGEAYIAWHSDVMAGKQAVILDYKSHVWQKRNI